MVCAQESFTERGESFRDSVVNELAFDVHFAISGSDAEGGDEFVEELVFPVFAGLQRAQRVREDFLCLAGQR